MELLLVIVVNIVLMFFYVELDLFQRFYALSLEYQSFPLGELLLLTVTVLLSMFYLVIRLWRKSVVYARLTKGLAAKDLLTKLHNRRTSEHTLQTEWDRYQRYHEDFCLLLFDIDDFSEINDSLGYIEGDRVLMDLANMLRENTRKTDSVARWGEDEFLIICPVCKAEQGAILAEKLRAMLYRTLKGGVELSASFAVVQSNPTQSLDKLIKRVDLALHKAKKRGKNCVLIG